MSSELTVQEGKDKFNACMAQLIKLECSKRKESDGTITYENAKLVIADVQRVFLNAIDTVPGNVQSACSLALAPLAPSAQERVMLVKNAIATVSGVGGIAALIAALGAALGWGAGVIASVTAWFTGASLLGPLAWAAIGVSLTVIAGYFVMKDSVDKFDVFENALIKGVSSTIDGIWNEYGYRLLKMTVK